MSDKNILIVSAHPDDHIYVAGTIMCLQKKGYRVYEILLTKGENGSYHKEYEYKKDDGIHNTRIMEYKKASEFLGICKTYFLDEVDSMVQVSSKLVFDIVNIIREVKPQIVITHSDKDTHRDHIETYKATIQAVQVSATTAYTEKNKNVWRVPVFLKFEGYMPETNNIYIDITPYYTDKKKLIDIYDSQKSKKIIQYTESSDKRNGIVIGVEYAESLALDYIWPVDLKFLMS